MSPRDPFLEPQQSEKNCDRFWARQAILKALNEVLQLFFGTLLDVGCGTMPYRSHIFQNSKIQRYLGLDFVEGKYAEAQHPDLVWDGGRIPLDDARVDCAMATEVLEHCPDPQALLREIHRVLRPRAPLFLTVPFLWPLHDMPNDYFRPSPFALETWLKEAGFLDIKIQATGGWDASLAQMLGLWLRRSPMSEPERKEFTRILFPFYEKLLRREDRTAPPQWAEMNAHSFMITGLWALAWKITDCKTSPLARSKEIYD